MGGIRSPGFGRTIGSLFRTRWFTQKFEEMKRRTVQDEGLDHEMLAFGLCL